SLGRPLIPLPLRFNSFSLGSLLMFAGMLDIPACEKLRFSSFGRVERTSITASKSIGLAFPSNRSCVKVKDFKFTNFEKLSGILVILGVDRKSTRLNSSHV